MKQIRRVRIELFATEGFRSPKFMDPSPLAAALIHEFECNKTSHLHKSMRHERICFIFETLESTHWGLQFKLF